MALELVKDKETREFFPPDTDAELLLQKTAIEHGLVLYCTLYTRKQQPLKRRGMLMLISPPLSISRTEVDEMIDRVDHMLTDWEGRLGLSPQ